MKKLLVLILGAVFVLAMYVPASAADWDLYGHARVNTFWENASEEISGFDDDVTELDHSLQGNARIGANVDAGDISGRFEYGTAGGNANIRLLYGTVDLGAGELEVGQDYTPWSWAGLGVSTQVWGDDINMLTHVTYNGRTPMVQYQINNFRVAAVEPTDVGGEILFPRIEAYYSVPLEGMSMGFSGAFQTYDLDDGAESGGGDTLNAYGFGAKFLFNMMDPVYLNLGGYYAINPADFGQLTTGLLFGGAGYNGSHLLDASGDVEDTTVMSLGTAVGVNLANGIGLQAGAGYTVAENDMWDEDPDTMTVYGQATIPINESGSAFIVPEIGFIDLGDDATGDEEGDVTYAGLKWQVNF